MLYGYFMITLKGGSMEPGTHASKL